MIELTEACSPYPFPRALSSDADGRVFQWLATVIGQLSPIEIEKLAIALAVNNPRLFEERLLEIQQDRELRHRREAVTPR